MLEKCTLTRLEHAWCDVVLWSRCSESAAHCRGHRHHPHAPHVLGLPEEGSGRGAAVLCALLDDAVFLSELAEVSTLPYNNVKMVLCSTEPQGCHCACQKSCVLDISSFQPDACVSGFACSAVLTAGMHASAEGTREEQGRGSTCAHSCQCDWRWLMRL